jgi:4-amino-4-deoxy-L-arabinose transferase-like glycosyltransferase
MQTPVDTSKPKEEKPDSASTAQSDAWNLRVWLFAIFALAFGVRACFAFVDGHSGIVFSCDASEYLRDARGLAQLITNSPNWTETFRLLNGSLSTQQALELRQQFAPVKELAIAGPIFPLGLLLSFASFGLPVTQANWQAPVIVQVVITSLTCVLIALIGKHAWNKNTGIAAGIIAALYPGFIVNSIRMYSESFSCFLLCAVVALTIPVVCQNGMFHSVTAGICLAFLQLTRSVMVLVTGLTFALTVWLSPGRSRILRLTGLILGMAIVFAPWLLFQQLAFGKSSIVVDRVGHYNLFIGTNISTNGYLSYPYPDGRGIEKQSYGALVAAQVKESPLRFARLMLDKPIRLLKFPWNDFRTPIGPFDMPSQVVFHQLMLAFAAIGATLCLFEKTETASRLRMRLLLAGLLGMHAVYLAFITVPRYNLTSIPFIALFAGAGLVTTFSAIRKSKSAEADSSISRAAALGLFGAIGLAMFAARIDWFSAVIVPSGASQVVSLVLMTAVKASPIVAFFVILFLTAKKSKELYSPARWISVALAAVAVPLCALPLHSHGRAYEWKASAESTHAVKQFIPLPLAKLESIKSRDCFIIVDSSSWHSLGNGARLLVNGVELKGAPLPLMPFTQNLSATKSRGANSKVEQHYLECEDIYSSLTAAAGGGNLDMRQWFAIPVPATLIRNATLQDEPGLSVEFSQKPACGGRLFGIYAEAHEKEVRLPSVARFSWEKAFYGVEDEQDFTDSRYDDRIAISQLRTSGNTTTWTRIPNIRLLIAPPSAMSGEPPALQADSENRNNALLEAKIASSESPDSGQVRLDASALGQSISDSETIIASVTAELNSSQTQTHNLPVAISAVFESTDKSGRKHRYRSPWVPTSLIASPGKNQYRFSLPFNPTSLPGRLESINVQCTPGGVASGSDYFGVKGPRQSRIQSGTIDIQKLESLTIDVYKLKSNPIGYGYEVL